MNEWDNRDKVALVALLAETFGPAVIEAITEEVRRRRAGALRNDEIPMTDEQYFACLDNRERFCRADH